MVDLATLVANLLAETWILDGYERSDDHQGRERNWVFWTKNPDDNSIRKVNTRIHVADPGGANESAELMAPTSLDEPGDTPFQDLVEANVSTYLAAHPEIEKWQWKSIDESNEWGKIIIWENDLSDNINEKLLFVYKNNGGITVRNLLTEYVNPDRSL
jgi:hypothetical protein